MSGNGGNNYGTNRSIISGTTPKNAGQSMIAGTSDYDTPKQGSFHFFNDDAEAHMQQESFNMNDAAARHMLQASADSSRPSRRDPSHFPGGSNATTPAGSPGDAESA